MANNTSQPHTFTTRDGSLSIQYDTTMQWGFAPNFAPTISVDKANAAKMCLLSPDEVARFTSEVATNTFSEAQNPPPGADRVDVTPQKAQTEALGNVKNMVRGCEEVQPKEGVPQSSNDDVEVTSMTGSSFGKPARSSPSSEPAGRDASNM